MVKLGHKNTKYKSIANYAIPQFSRMLTTVLEDVGSDVHQQLQDGVRIIEEHSQLVQPLKEI